MRIETIDPATDPAWEEFLQRQPNATPFHTAAWANVLRDAYGFEPQYLVARNGNGNGNDIVGGIAMARVNGKRLVGLPFSDTCPPLLPRDETGEALLDAAKRAVDSDGIEALELRGPSALDLEARGVRVGASFLRHTIPLDADLATIEARFRGSARRAIAQARRLGLTVRVSRSLDDMRRFYQLNLLTRRKHGLVPQPWRFFESIQRRTMQDGESFLLLCEHEGQTIAADLLLAYKNMFVSKFNASDARFLQLRPNHLIFQHTIELGLDQGYTSIDLGRTERDHEGLRRFKLGFGSVEEPLDYYYYPPAAEGSWSSGATPPGLRLMAVFARHAPAWALKLAGSVLYKYAA